MPKSEVIMNAEQRVRWFNARDPLHKWTVGQDVYCLHCDGIFKAQDVFEDEEGDPNCPVCKRSSPIDFHPIPWWREDLTDEVTPAQRFIWRVAPIQAAPGKPSVLPPRPQERRCGICGAFVSQCCC
jgi:hypothetical protein